MYNIFFNNLALTHKFIKLQIFVLKRKNIYKQANKSKKVLYTNYTTFDYN